MHLMQISHGSSLPAIVKLLPEGLEALLRPFQGGLNAFCASDEDSRGLVGSHL